jgi:hypothetical protein
VQDPIDFDEKSMHSKELSGPDQLDEEDSTSTDTHEPNDTFEFAKNVETATTLSSYISSENDVDNYKLTPTQSGSMSITLDVPIDKDYDILVYDKDGNIKNLGVTGSVGTSETVYLNVEAYNSYYLRVYGSNSNFSNEAPYDLELGYISLDISTISTNQTLGLVAPPGQSYVFKFTPEKSGDYKIFTSALGGYSVLVMTEIASKQELLRFRLMIQQQ